MVMSTFTDREKIVRRPADRQKALRPDERAEKDSIAERQKIRVGMHRRPRPPSPRPPPQRNEPGIPLPPAFARDRRPLGVLRRLPLGHRDEVVRLAHARKV